MMTKTRCPDDEILSDYLEGRLTEKQRAGMEAHLADCDTCLDVMLTLRQIVRSESATDPVPEPLTRDAIHRVNALNPVPPGDMIRKKAGKLVQGISGWVSRNLSPAGWMDGNMVPVRGAEGGTADRLVRIERRFDDLETKIEIEKTGENTAIIRILPQNGAENVRVTLFRNGREAASLMLALEGVVFEDLKFGPYRLAFTRKGREIGAYAFEIRETRHD